MSIWSVTITGGHIKYLVGPTVHTETHIFRNFYHRNNIWFYLLWSPVNTTAVGTGQIDTSSATVSYGPYTPGYFTAPAASQEMTRALLDLLTRRIKLPEQHICLFENKKMTHAVSTMGVLWNCLLGCLTNEHYVVRGGVIDRRDVLDLMHGVKIRGRDTLYAWTGSPIKSVLVGAHVCCFLRDKRRPAVFLPCTRRPRVI